METSPREAASDCPDSHQQSILHHPLLKVSSVFAQSQPAPSCPCRTLYDPVVACCPAKNGLTLINVKRWGWLTFIEVAGLSPRSEKVVVVHGSQPLPLPGRVS